MHYAKMHKLINEFKTWKQACRFFRGNPKNISVYACHDQCLLAVTHPKWSINLMELNRLTSYSLPSQRVPSSWQHICLLETTSCIFQIPPQRLFWVYLLQTVLKNDPAIVNNFQNTSMCYLPFGCGTMLHVLVVQPQPGLGCGGLYLDLYDDLQFQ